MIIFLHKKINDYEGTSSFYNRSGGELYQMRIKGS